MSDLCCLDSNRAQPKVSRQLSEAGVSLSGPICVLGLCADVASRSCAGSAAVIRCAVATPAPARALCLTLVDLVVEQTGPTTI